MEAFLSVLLMAALLFVIKWVGVGIEVLIRKMRGQSAFPEPKEEEKSDTQKTEDKE